MNMISFFEIVAKIERFLFIFRPENIVRIPASSMFCYDLYCNFISRSYILYNLTVGKNRAYIWSLQIYK